MCYSDYREDNFFLKDLENQFSVAKFSKCLNENFIKYLNVIFSLSLNVTTKFYYYVKNKVGEKYNFFPSNL